MIYLTRRRLMDESETTIDRGSRSDDAGSSRICRQLIDNQSRYALWHVSHEQRMSGVSIQRERDRQIVALRSVYLQQIHRAALVRYLHKNRVTGTARDLALQEFHGVADPQRAAVAEHKAYLISASSQLCAYHLLNIVGDTRGLALIQDYQGTYEQFFAMFCENANAARTRSHYLLRALLPGARAEADALRKRILGGDVLPRLQRAAGPGLSRRARYDAAASTA